MPQDLGYFRHRRTVTIHPRRQTVTKQMRGTTARGAETCTCEGTRSLLDDEHAFRLKPNENVDVPKRLFGLLKYLFGFPKRAFGKAKRIVNFRLAVLRTDQSVGIKVAPFGRY